MVTSKYVGVRLRSYPSKWDANVIVAGHQYYLGQHDTQEQAAQERDKWVLWKAPRPFLQSAVAI